MTECTHKHLRNSMAMKKWRDAVVKRDDRTCQSCGEYSKHIEAHHGIFFSASVLAALDKRAKSEERSRLWMVNRLMRDFLKEKVGVIDDEES